MMVMMATDGWSSALIKLLVPELRNLVLLISDLELQMNFPVLWCHH